MGFQETYLQEIIDSYEDLISNFSLQNSSKFAKNIWLLPINTALKSMNFERLVYLVGDNAEVYTSKERKFIAKYNSILHYCEYDMLAKNDYVSCKLVIANLLNSRDVVGDSIAFMKIFNKACKGFNSFIFVNLEGIVFGCSSINSSRVRKDCVVSPLVSRNANWELLFDLFLSRSDSVDFYDYYSSLVGCILSIPDCLASSYSNTNYLEEDNLYDFDYDKNCFEDARKFRVQEWIENARKIKNDKEETLFDKAEFEAEVNCYMDSLRYIKSDKINPLELLFESEKTAVNESQSINEEQKHTIVVKDNAGNTSAFDMLDDPIALIKALKKNGFN